MEAHALVGRLALARRRFDAAIAAYNQAAELGYEADTWLGRATAYWQSGHKAQAIAVLRQLFWLRPDLIWIRQRMIEMQAAMPPEERTP
jgi:tetratricopeptide (TPR) repeat protein